MNKIITTITFLLCLTMPMNFFGMLNITKIKQPTAPKTYQQLIAALKANRKITTADFINCLNDAKKQNFILYFISQDLIDSSSLKNEISALFQENISNPSAFNDEANKPIFKTSAITTGFICLANKNLYDNAYSSSVILTKNPGKLDLKEKIIILSMFNIIPSSSDQTTNTIDNKEILSFPLQPDDELESFYNAIIDKKKEIKEIVQENSTITPVTLSPGVKPEEEQKKQTQLAEGYEPIAEAIKSIVDLPVTYKDKADILIQNLKAGSLDKEKIKEAENFFIDMDKRIKKIKKEKIEQITSTDSPESTKPKQREKTIAAPAQKSLIPSIDGIDIYTIPLSKYAIKSLKGEEEEKEETITIKNYE